MEVIEVETDHKQVFTEVEAQELNFNVIITRKEQQPNTANEEQYPSREFWGRIKSLQPFSTIHD